MMKKNEKEALIALMGAAGLIILLVGIFFEELEFVHALAVALALWILSGVVKKYLGMDKKK
jgi:hypothetical protein